MRGILENYARARLEADSQRRAGGGQDPSGELPAAIMTAMSDRASSTNEPLASDAWHLRSASLADVDGLHRLASEPLVYRYLFDGIAPERHSIEQEILRATRDAEATGLGLWILACPRVPYGGCVQLRPNIAAKSAELIYLLHPAQWGRGLATRMAWTAICRAFRLGIDRIVAGSDSPNGASLAVMRRLGMRLHRDVCYPLGQGVEYVLARGDPGPRPAPALLALH
jgi:ribosomal-protein-alanine N-acetyltransferase